MQTGSIKIWLFRASFCLGLAFAVTMALLPEPPKLLIDNWGDKAEHMLAFGVLAILGSAAFRGMPLQRLGERLSFLGAVIEVCQSIPALHRDCDIRDWIADTLATIIALLIVQQWRRFRSTGLSSAAALNDGVC